MKQTNTGRRYDAQFREQAVQLLLQSDKSLSQIADELGVSAPTLKYWKKNHFKAAPTHVRRQGTKITAADLDAEVQRLRQELQRVTRQRDILKKSLGILSEEPLQKGMPT
jgi:transposase